MKLSTRSLNRLPKTVARPRYDRSGLTPGILHIGLGNFHRAHQAWYTHRLMQDGAAGDWAIIGAGVRPYDADMREKLLAQDGLTTLIELDPAGVSAEVTGAMIDYLPIAEGNGPLIDGIADPAIRIVSLTVTEGGYYRNAGSGGFDADHPDIRHDAVHRDHPVTAFGAIVAALGRRRAADTGPLTLLSCDNLQGNGDILRRTVVSLARLTDPELADWIDAECSFPNSMVDCIVPATGPKELALAAELGIDDACPVTHENFRQWVIEDDFCAGRPDWDRVGVTFTADVHPYELMKLRILNGGHQVIANVGELLSIDTISGCMANPPIAALFDTVARAEIVPHVAAVPGMTPGAYVDLIATRFSNPRIADTTRRVAFDGSSRHPGFILPAIRDALAAGTPVDGLALVEAIWARMCDGTREDGSEIAPNDPDWTALQVRAQQARTDPAAWLAMAHVYGETGRDPRFSEAFARALRMIWAEGVVSAIRTYVAAGRG